MKPIRVKACPALAAALLLTGCGEAERHEHDWLDETAHYYRSGQVDAGNVKALGVAWEFDGFVVRGRTHRGVEATPIVVGETMYVSGPWSVVYALDARTGRLRWQYDPNVDGAFARRTCCDVVNRGVAVDDGTVFVATLDGYLAALDAATGQPRWKTDTIIDRSRSYAITGAPRIAGPNILIGNGGAEMGVRGYVSAYDRETGKLAWRFFTVPGDPARGDEHPEITAARKTWSKDSRWDLGGGGTVWDSIVYDPDTRIAFIGTGNGMPHPAWTRSPGGGDNLYLSSILALDARTGRLRWHYQTTPGDSWDYTATQNMVLADLIVAGRTRKVIMQAPKNGFFYVLDRVTGELLSAEKFTTVTWADRVDLKTGRPVVAEQGNFAKAPKLVWPSEAGGHNWPPMSFSPETRLVYIPVLEAPMTFEVTPEPYRPYSVIQGSTGVFPPAGEPPADNAGLRALVAGQPSPKFNAVLKAWDPVRQKVAWTSPALPFWSGGTMATASGLVMQGSADGYLTIYEARTGKRLHRVNLGTGIMASPMSYTIDETEYIAVTAGFGGALNAEYPPGSAARRYENRERLVVFKLRGRAPTLPPARREGAFTVAPARYHGDAAAVARGRRLFVQHCERCHGGAQTVGGYPNLWKMAPETHAAFDQIVTGGALTYAGMASFSDVLTPRDVKDIHAYVATPAAATTSSGRMH